LTFISNALSTDTGQPAINTTTPGAPMTDKPQVVAGGGAAGTTDYMLGSVSVANKTDLVSGTISGVESNAAHTAYSINISDEKLSQVQASFATGGQYASYGISAVVDAGNGGGSNNDGKTLTFFQSSG